MGPKILSIKWPINDPVGVDIVVAHMFTGGFGAHNPYRLQWVDGDLDLRAHYQYDVPVAKIHSKAIAYGEWLEYPELRESGLTGLTQALAKGVDIKDFSDIVRCVFGEMKDEDSRARTVIMTHALMCDPIWKTQARSEYTSMVEDVPEYGMWLGRAKAEFEFRKATLGLRQAGERLVHVDAQAKSNDRARKITQLAGQQEFPAPVASLEYPRKRRRLQ